MFKPFSRIADFISESYIINKIAINIRVEISE